MLIDQLFLTGPENQLTSNVSTIESLTPQGESDKLHHVNVQSGVT